MKFDVASDRGRIVADGTTWVVEAESEFSAAQMTQAYSEHVVEDAAIRTTDPWYEPLPLRLRFASSLPADEAALALSQALTPGAIIVVDDAVTARVVGASIEQPEPLTARFDADVRIEPWVGKERTASAVSTASDPLAVVRMTVGGDLPADSTFRVIVPFASSAVYLGCGFGEPTVSADFSGTTFENAVGGQVKSTSTPTSWTSLGYVQRFVQDFGTNAVVARTAVDTGSASLRARASAASQFGTAKDAISTLAPSTSATSLAWAFLGMVTEPAVQVRSGASGYGVPLQFASGEKSGSYCSFGLNSRFSGAAGLLFSPSKPTIVNGLRFFGFANIESVNVHIAIWDMSSVVDVGYGQRIYETSTAVGYPEGDIYIPLPDVSLIGGRTYMLTFAPVGLSGAYMNLALASSAGAFTNRVYRDSDTYSAGVPSTWQSLNISNLYATGDTNGTADSGLWQTFTWSGGTINLVMLDAAITSPSPTECAIQALIGGAWTNIMSIPLAETFAQSSYTRFSFRPTTLLPLRDGTYRLRFIGSNLIPIRKADTSYAGGTSSQTGYDLAFAVEGGYYTATTGQVYAVLEGYEDTRDVATTLHVDAKAASGTLNGYLDYVAMIPASCGFMRVAATIPQNTGIVCDVADRRWHVYEANASASGLLLDGNVDSIGGAGVPRLLPGRMTVAALAHSADGVVPSGTMLSVAWRQRYLSLDAALEAESA